MEHSRKETESANTERVYGNEIKVENDEKSIDYDYYAKDYPIMEHLSNARLMPMTGPYGGLDLLDTYEYGTVPVDPDTPLESHEFVMEKNKQK